MATYSLITTGGADQTAYLQDSLTLKANTFDFTLYNPSIIPVIGDTVTFTWPGMNVPWTGTVAARTITDPTNKGNSYLANFTATNTTTYPAVTAPFDLDQNPANNTTLFEKEDGTGHIILEDGTPTGPGSYLTEGTLSYDYQNPVFHQSTNVVPPAGNSTTFTFNVTVFQIGLWANMTTNVSWSPGAVHLGPNIPLVVQKITVNWLTGPNAPPVYTLELGLNPPVAVTVTGQAV